jgi:hypothetical protein
MEEKNAQLEEVLETLEVTLDTTRKEVEELQIAKAARDAALAVRSHSLCHSASFSCAPCLLYMCCTAAIELFKQVSLWYH